MNSHDAMFELSLPFPTAIEAFLDEGGKASSEEATATEARERDFLALYFREMSALSVLQPPEERQKARELERREQALWRRALRHRKSAELVLRMVEEFTKESPEEFAVLRKCLAQDKEKVLACAAERAATQVRLLDVDRQLQLLVFVELQRRIEELRQKPRPRKADLAEIADLTQHVRSLERLLQKALRVKNDFVKANLRLVVGIARRFHRGRMPLSDLIQEGNIGLIKAVERFDHRRGYRFSTYASWWIRHAISRALADKGRAIRLPVHMIDAYGRLTRSSQEIAGRLGREPTTEELAKETGLPKAKIEKLRSHLFSQPYSLDRPIAEDDGRRFLEFLQQEDQVNPFDTLLQEGLLAEVRRQMQELNPMEAEILKWRFGLDIDREYTLKEIGEKYNLSRERIRQLQEQALSKIRVGMRRKELL